MGHEFQRAFRWIQMGFSFQFQRKKGGEKRKIENPCFHPKRRFFFLKEAEAKNGKMKLRRQRKPTLEINILSKDTRANVTNRRTA